MPKDTDELARIRKRKMEALMQESQRREEIKTVAVEKDKEREHLIKTIFLPEAVTYLKELERAKPQVAKRIEDLAILLYLRRQLTMRIPKEGVVLVQRRLEGVEPKITVKRRGEDAVSFYEAVRKDLAESD